MRFALPILNDRISPRPTSARWLALVDTKNPSRSVEHIEIDEPNLIDLLDVLKRDDVDILVCCGIDLNAKHELADYGIDVIENVACSESEAVEAIYENRLEPGFGLYKDETNSPSASTDDSSSSVIEDLENSRKKFTGCLILDGKPCTGARNCPLGEPFISADDDWSRHMMDAALDVAMEQERSLCRLSEVIYFCLGMKYTTVGVAFCSDLEEPARIAASVLKRFFNVVGVCCKVGPNGSASTLSDDAIPYMEGEGRRQCNPLAQAQLLNRAQCDLVILIGLCVGADCILTKACKAPVTALFVKDKVLANNPIGAIYSKRYLKESLRALSQT